MTDSRIHIGIVHYPGAMLSAVQGLAEQFYLANRMCRQQRMEERFKTHLCDSLDIPERGRDGLVPLQVLILPPSLDDELYASPSTLLVEWLRENHRNGAIICSVCAGAFVLAETGLLDGRRVTTHWALADELSRKFPDITVDSSRILINDGDVVTAGGLMSWVDLGLELVAQFSNSKVMRQLGKYLIVDTGDREQSYYQSFTPRLDHGDDVIVRVQHRLQRGYNRPVKIGELAEQVHLTERTFLRRFVRATGLKPVQYLQHLRIQKACDLIETSNLPVERVAEHVGYEDLSAFRKTFIKITGQTPREFKQRFVRELPAR